MVALENRSKISLLKAISLLAFGIFVCYCDAQSCDDNVKRKSLNSSSNVTCEQCNSTHCYVVINGNIVTATEAGITESGILSLPSNILGKVTCGPDEQSLVWYKICLLPNEVYGDGMLTLTANIAQETVLAVGDKILFTCSTQHLCHGSISLKVDRNIDQNKMACESEGDVVGKVLYYKCTVLQTGVFSVHAHMPFCDVDIDSQTLTLRVEEQQQITSSNSTVDPSATTSANVSMATSPAAMNQTSTPPSSSVTDTPSRSPSVAVSSTSSDIISASAINSGDYDFAGWAVAFIVSIITVIIMLTFATVICFVVCNHIKKYHNLKTTVNYVNMQNDASRNNTVDVDSDATEGLGSTTPTTSSSQPDDISVLLADPVTASIDHHQLPTDSSPAQVDSESTILAAHPSPREHLRLSCNLQDK